MGAIGAVCPDEDRGAGLGNVVDTGLHQTPCWRWAWPLEALGLATHKRVKVCSAKLN